MNGAPTIESLNKSMRTLIKELYMVGSYGSQRAAIEEVGYNRFNGLVPDGYIQSSALRIVINLYLDVATEPLHTQLKKLILEAITVDHLKVLVVIGQSGLTERPEFADATTPITVEAYLATAEEAYRAHTSSPGNAAVLAYRASTSVPRNTLMDVAANSTGQGNGTLRNNNPYYRDEAEIRYALNVIKPSSEIMEAETIPKIDGDVFDFSNGEAYESVTDYLLETGSDACLFIYKDRLMAFSKRRLSELIENGEAVFYECRKIFPFDPRQGQLGTFEPTDIKKAKYVEIAMNGRFTFPMGSARKLFTSHGLWRIEETAKILPVTASWSMALHGGPVSSSVHCQDGTQKHVYGLTPVKFARRTASPAPDSAVVKIKRGENVQEINLAAGADVASVKGRFASATGVDVGRVRFIFGGKILKNTDTVTPGSTLQAMVRDEGGTRRDRRVRRKTRKRMHKTVSPRM